MQTRSASKRKLAETTIDLVSRGDRTPAQFRPGQQHTFCTGLNTKHASTTTNSVYSGVCIQPSRLCPKWRHWASATHQLSAPTTTWMAGSRSKTRRKRTCENIRAIFARTWKSHPRPAAENVPQTNRVASLQTPGRDNARKRHRSRQQQDRMEQKDCRLQGDNWLIDWK